MLSQNSDSPALYLCSSIPNEYRRELEDIFFFNPKQELVAKKVEEHIRVYGTPSIRSADGHISLQLSKIQDAQALFIMMRGKKAKLIGVLLYIREGNLLRVLYFALMPESTLNWQASCSIISSVIGLLKDVARCIKGVEQIQISVTAKSALFNV
jgi:hypothetical protein